jgi:hypothetical protein
MSPKVLGRQRVLKCQDELDSSIFEDRNGHRMFLFFNA